MGCLNSIGIAAFLSLPPTLMSVSSNTGSNLRLLRFQDGAEDGSRVASSEKTLQVFVCFVSFFVVLRVRCC